jgi:hypothetical protein
MNSNEHIANFLNQAKDFSDAELWAAVDQLQTLLKPKSLQKKEAKAAATDGKKAKKERDPDAPKRPANAAILFTSQFIRPLMNALAASESDAVVKKEMLGVKCVSQISATFWAKLKPLSEEERETAKEAITEKEVFEAYKTWKSTAPVVTVPVSAETAVPVSITSSTASEAHVVDKNAAKAAEKEAKKAAAAAEKEAKKAAEKAEKAAAKEAEKAAKKAAKKAAPAPAPEPVEEDDAAAVPFAYEGKELFKTKDGRVYNEEGNWYGLYDAKTKKVDTSVPEPEYEN